MTRAPTKIRLMSPGRLRSREQMFPCWINQPKVISGLRFTLKKHVLPHVELFEVPFLGYIAMGADIQTAQSWNLGLITRT